MKYFSHSWEILLAIDPDDMVDVDLKLTFTLLVDYRFVRPHCLKVDYHVFYLVLTSN